MNLRALNRKKNLALRAFKAKVAKSVFDSKNTNIFKKENVSIIKKICFLRNDNKIGDMIVATSVFKEFKKAIPNVEISVVTGPACKSIVLHNPNVNKIFVYKRNLRAIYKLGKTLQQEHFDLYIDMDKANTFESLFLLWLTKPKYAFGFNRQNYKMYNITCDFDFNKHHITEWYQQLFNCLGLDSYTNLSYELFLSEQEENNAKMFLQSLPSRPTILINAFAGSQQRCLTVEQIQTLVKNLKDYNCVLIGPKNRMQNFISNVDWPSNFYHSPFDFSLYDIFALIKLADLLISPDTSYVHAASAFNTKQVAIYNKDDVINTLVWKPLGDNSHLVYATYPYSLWNTQDFVREIEKNVKAIV